MNNGNNDRREEMETWGENSDIFGIWIFFLYSAKCWMRIRPRDIKWEDEHEKFIYLWCHFLSSLCSKRDIFLFMLAWRRYKTLKLTGIFCFLWVTLFDMWHENTSAFSSNYGIMTTRGLLRIHKYDQFPSPLAYGVTPSHYLNSSKFLL